MIAEDEVSSGKKTSEQAAEDLSKRFKTYADERLDYNKQLKSWEPIKGLEKHLEKIAPKFDTYEKKNTFKSDLS